MKENKFIEKLFSQKNCERCGKKLRMRTVSFLNNEIICPECKEDEKCMAEYMKKTSEWMKNLPKIYSDIPKKGNIKRAN